MSIDTQSRTLTDAHQQPLKVVITGTSVKTGKQWQFGVICLSKSQNAKLSHYAV